MEFDGKQEARDYVWRRLEETKVARFPFPPRGRIPNFEGAEKAAKRLASHRLFEEATTVKINPDAPQRPVREAALRAGKTVIVPTPRLRAGFLRFEPEAIDDDCIRDATMISRWEPWADAVAVDELPAVDLVVTGCVAVTKRGERAGKGHGYSDLEYAILQELGHRNAPVATTVHDHQVVDAFLVEDHDLHIDLVVTPTRWWESNAAEHRPAGIDWALLDDEDLDAMPVLKQLQPGDQS